LTDSPGKRILDRQQPIARFSGVDRFKHIAEGVAWQNINAIAEMLPDSQLGIRPVNALKGNNVASRHRQLLSLCKVDLRRGCFSQFAPGGENSITARLKAPMQRRAVAG